MDEQALREAVRRLDLQVAIDGPAGAGKSTVGRGLADALACTYLDTGLMYRAITRLALREAVPLSRGETLAELAARTAFSLPSGGELLVDGHPAGNELRTPDVDAAVSEVSSHPEVRARLVLRQRELAAGRCIVMVGRDIGTVVLPEAPVKLWVTAAAEERARRRRAEDLSSDAGLNDREVLTRILERDRYDSERAESPLKRPPDATEIRTDGVSPQAAIEEAVAAVRLYLERVTAAS